MATKKEQNKLLRLKAAGFPKSEIDRRMAQSASNQANSLSRPARRKAHRKSVKSQIREVEARRGGGMRAAESMSGARSLARRQSVRVNEYLQTLLHPERFISHIPDLVTFPRGLQQVRSVITASTYVDDTVPSKEGKSKGKGVGALVSDDSVIIAIFPYLKGCFNPYNGSFELDGTSYTDTAFDVHGYSTAISLLNSYRMVSMSFNVEYIGPALNNQGQIACANFPAFYESAITFGGVSEYNFSYTGAARDGAYQIWLPGGLADFWTEQSTATSAFPKSFLTLAAKGLPLPDAVSGEVTYLPVFRIEVTMNIETYSTSQMLTATQKAGGPDYAKLGQALTVSSKAAASKLTNGKSQSSDSIYQQIGAFAKQAGDFVWNNKQWIIPAAMQVGELFV